MRINWFSNSPWASTGYGNQTKLFVPRIAKLGHEMTMTAFYGLNGGIVGSPFDGIKVYPNGRHPYGQDVIGAHAIDAKADAIISLFDIWPMQPENIPSSIKWFPWFPIDSEPMPPQVLQKAMIAEKPIVMSKFGKSMAEQMGLDAYYVPHGIDTKLFRNIDQTLAREYLSFPKDKFIVGTVAANKGVPPRKSWYELIVAFSALKQQHKDVMFYIHTDDGTRGGETVDIAKFCQVMGLKVGYIKEYNAEPYSDIDVLIVDQYINLLGAPDDYMVAVYNALDVMMLVSRGEGFGIPIVEAQACGCPVIVGDWTAMSELCFSGWKVRKDEAIPEWQTYQDAWMYQPKIDAIVDRLLSAYEMKGNQDYRKRAREGALYYDVNKVTEKYWKPVLADMETRIENNSNSQCAHEFIQVGLYNKDGSMSIPCKKCGAELIIKGQSKKIIIDGFKNPHGFKFNEPDGLEYIIMRELERDYNIPEPTRPGVVAIDIGAHVGIVTMYMEKIGYKVYGYEPSILNFNRLVENLSLNKLTSEVHQMAVTKDGRNVKISSDINNSGGNNIYQNNGKMVKSVSINEIIEKHGFIDLLKIDCEGAEFEILENADLSKIGSIRGEFHGKGAKELLEKVNKIVPDTIVTLQGGEE